MPALLGFVILLAALAAFGLAVWKLGAETRDGFGVMVRSGGPEVPSAVSGAQAPRANAWW